VRARSAGPGRKPALVEHRDGARDMRRSGFYGKPFVDFPLQETRTVLW
jgi:hypothetical protein